MAVRKGMILLGMLLLCGLLSSCAVQGSPIERDMKFLTSDEAAGRLSGTAGNDLARDYIAEQFQAAGLAFYGGAQDYFQDYEQETHDPGKQTQVLKVTFSDGTETEYRAGREIPCILDKTAEGVAGRLASDPHDPEIEDKVFLQKTGDEENRPENCRGILQQSDRLSPYAVAAEIPLIKVPTNVFEKIAEKGVAVEIVGTLQSEKKTVQNVVGVKKGSGGRNAIIIGAHFDHVGGYGSHIYRGALDNASGTAVLLDLVRQSAGESFPALESDLIFCAFNGEESLLQGSRAFVSALSGYETVNMLNIDCVGAPEVGPLAVEQGGDPALTEKLVSYLNNAQLPCKEGADTTSDQATFSGMGYPAVGLATQDESKAIHVLSDTMEQIDCAELARLADALPGFLAELDKALVPMGQAASGQKGGYRISYQDIPQEIQRGAREEGRHLVEEYQVGYEETIYFPFQGFYFYTSGNYPIASPQEVQERYPALSIPEQLQELHFQCFMESSADGLAILEADSMEELPLEPTVKKGSAAKDTPSEFMLVYERDDDAFVISVNRTDINRVLIGGEDPDLPPWEAHSECSVQPAKDQPGQAVGLSVPGAEGTGYAYWVTKSPSFSLARNSSRWERDLDNMSGQDLETIYSAIRKVLEPALNKDI